MAELKEARVPDIGNYDGVPVIELLVSVGDTVSADQGLVTLESDKATMEVPAPFAGVVRELRVKVGDRLVEGAVVAMIEPADAGAAASGPSSDGAQPKADTAQVATSPAQPRPSETPDRVEPVATSGEPDKLAQREIAAHTATAAAPPQPATSPNESPRTPPVTFDAG